MEELKFMKRTFKDKFGTTVVKSSKGHGYIACFYTWWGQYTGCKHLEYKEVEEYINTLINVFGYEEVVE